MTATDRLELSPLQHVLANSCQPQLRNLSVIETDDRVIITGRVSSYFIKSLALESVKNVVDHRSLILNIEVEA